MLKEHLRIEFHVQAHVWIQIYQFGGNKMTISQEDLYCATLFIYDKMSLSFFYTPSFSKHSFTEITYMTFWFFISFTALAHEVLYTDDTFAYNIWIYADDESSYYGFMKYETMNLVSTYEWFRNAHSINLQVWINQGGTAVGYTLKFLHI